MLINPPFGSVINPPFGSDWPQRWPRDCAPLVLSQVQRRADYGNGSLL